MSGLFKNKAIKTKLEGYEIPDFENKLSKVKMWHEAYENKSLHKKSESQCEQAFNQSFFIEILGYRGFPNETYTIDPKGSVDVGGQKPDAILGFFAEEKRRIIAVVEIKDVNTSLDKSQKREGNMSPVQQAFKYKPQYKECDFVIATNFFEIRLLKDNQLDFESFTLESLVDPKDNYFQFRKFYYLLNAENFIAKSGETNTLKLLSDIRIEQEQITTEFYRKYQDLRQELIKNILKNNQEARIRESFYVLAVEKAQKIIDRLVFICFCEDLDLLPDDKLQEVVFHTEKLGLTIPIWDIMKSFFTAIDCGSEKLGIPDGYNGELFKEDEALNSLKIDDEICKKFVDLGKYDFSEDLSVNILGHIFEQSISDLEELKSIAEKTAQESEAPLKTSKRKKEGIYYTPDYIVDYIVKNSLGKYLEEQEQFILTKHGVNTDLTDENYHKRMKTAYEEYREKLRNIKILDPACGSGAFLVKVYDYLLAENKRIGAILTDISGGKGDLFNVESYIKSLLQNNIYGVDLNPESVEITKLSLWLKTARKGEKLVSLKNNIKCGNSLIDDSTIAGERAFKWEEEFLEIMKSGGFDVIVGNPPYVSNWTLSAQNKAIVAYLEDKYSSFISGHWDLFLCFIALNDKLLKKNGYHSFILPTSFFKEKYAQKMRKIFLNKYEIKEIIDFGEKIIFENVARQTAIYVVCKRQNSNNFILLKNDLNDEGELIPQPFFLRLNNCMLKTGIREKDLGIYRKIEDGSILLGRIVCINTGVVAHSNLKSPVKFKKEDVIFKEYKEGFKKYILGSNLQRYLIVYDNDYLDYEKNLNYFHRPKFKELFESNKIIVRRISGDGNKIMACFDDQGYYTNDNFMHLVLWNDIILQHQKPEKKWDIIDDSRFNLKFLLTILCSKLITFFFSKFISTDTLQGNYSGIYPEDLRKMPIKDFTIGQQKSFIEKADIMLSLHKDFQAKLQKALKLLQQEFQLEKINTKLEKFYELDFDGFIKTLGIKKLDLQKKGELLDFFEKNKQELSGLKTQIDTEDALIDAMVYKLYGLTDEEIKTVESSVNP